MLTEVQCQVRFGEALRAAFEDESGIFHDFVFQHHIFNVLKLQIEIPSFSY